MSSEERDLVRRAQGGEPGALREIVRANIGPILRAAQASGLSAERAEDVTQSTFATFIEKAGSFEGRSSIRTFLFGILYKKIAEERREVRKETRFDDIDDVMERRFAAGGGWTRPPERVDVKLYRRQVRRYIEECLERLSVSQKAAFVFREVEGLATAEICKILDLTVTNLGVVLHRARNRLRECLEAKGIRGGEDAVL